MSKHLSVLMAEDEPIDAEISARVLRGAGFILAWRRVDRLCEIRQALERQLWDVVLGDHSIPGFRSADVLDLPPAGETPAARDRLGRDRGTRNGLPAARAGSSRAVCETVELGVETVIFRSVSGSRPIPTTAVPAKPRSNARTPRSIA